MTTAEIKALRMKLAAKKVPGGRYKGKTSVGGTYRSVKPFTESLHPRVRGRFVSKPGSGKLKTKTKELLAKSKSRSAIGERSDGLHASAHIRELRKAARVDSSKPSSYEVASETLRIANKESGKRLSRAKELRAQRAAKREAKPSLKEQAAADPAHVVTTKQHAVEQAARKKEINRQIKVALATGGKVPYDLRTLVESRASAATIRKVYRGKQS